jgi:hypothetical protein
MKNLHTFDEFLTENLNEAGKEKFLLYTNPGNSTNRAYVAIGSSDVKEVLSDSRKYRDSYLILHQGSGTQDDLIKAKRMFSNYRFGDETIGESIDESINEADMSKEYDGFVVLDYKSKKQYKFRYSRGNNVPQEDDAIYKLMKSTRLPRSSFAVHGFVKKGEWNKSEFPEFKD